jgi:hypothetical protein
LRRRQAAPKPALELLLSTRWRIATHLFTKRYRDARRIDQRALNAEAACRQPTKINTDILDNSLVNLYVDN